ncbi:protein GDAP2 homolog [Folsomia candida]|uniref:protein GDAP2 homolog n=1 Tax=Folsomia candida TaxID=158441 RepID=UPI000B8F16EB|nr:protein GDAP2 homolog [Folsomia candida]XP_035710629.1 protein GDAP2 homolog [Folsomia candida]
MGDLEISIGDEPTGAVKWSEMDLTNLDLNTWNYINRNFDSSPFPIDPVINSRIALWFGDILSLTVDGLATTTNESLDEIQESILFRTGSNYPQEIRNEIKSIRTGEARVVSGHPNLPCRNLLLTVTPRFSEKYKTAAETALYSCYSSVLEKVSEKRMETVAIPPLHLGGKTNFPDELGVHVAIRTVRRFLEKGHSYPRLIVLCVPDPKLFSLYLSFMVCHFPREPAHEEYACVRLPTQIGDEEGAAWLPDRKIRIFANPAEHPERNEEDDLGVGIMEQLNRDFVQMKEDIDKERLITDGRKRRSFSSLSEPERNIAIEIETKERQERILRRARTEDLSSIEKTGCLYRSGQDRCGRQIVVVVGKWFRPEAMDLDKTFLYLVRLLDDIDGPYCVVYFHAATGTENRPGLKWMRAVYDNLEYRFKKNLKALYIIHPTMWTKVMCWWFLTFLAPNIKQKLLNVPGLSELYAAVEPNQIKIPAYISEHDITLHGFGAIAYSHTHSGASTPVK